MSHVKRPRGKSGLVRRKSTIKRDKKKRRTFHRRLFLISRVHTDAGTGPCAQMKLKRRVRPGSMNAKRSISPRPFLLAISQSAEEGERWPSTQKGANVSRAARKKPKARPIHHVLRCEEALVSQPAAKEHSTPAAVSFSEKKTRTRRSLSLSRSLALSRSLNPAPFWYVLVNSLNARAARLRLDF